MSRSKSATSASVEYENQLRSLNVRPSPIHGNGLFAKERIKKDTYIGTYEGPTAQRNGKYVLWMTDEKGREVGRRGLNKLRFLNHSSKPNTEFDGYDLYALRSIGPDAELTFDYGWDE